MRLRDYQNLLKEVLFKLKQINKTNVPNQTRGLGVVNDARVSGLIEYNQAIDKLIQANLFEDLTTKIRVYEVFHRAENEVIVGDSSWSSLKSLNEKLIIRIHDLVNTLNNILTEENRESINIKLPEYKTFEEYNNLFKSLKIVFAPFDFLQVTTNLNNFETGSKWINISFNKPSKEDLKTIALYVLLFFNMANGSLDLRNKYLEGEKSIAYIKQYETQVSEQERKKLLEAFEILHKTDNNKYEQYKEEIIKKILTDSGIELSDENKNEIMPRMGTSLETMGKLMDEGMEIVPALNAPDEIKILSTNFNEKLEEHKNLMIGVNTQKLIEKKNIEENIQEDKKNEGNINDEK